MRNNNLRLTLYQKTSKWRFISYLMAALIVLIPIFIVAVTGKAFSSSYSKMYISTAIVFVIIGKLLSAYKKKVESGVFPSTDIASIVGISIVLVWTILK